MAATAAALLTALLVTTWAQVASRRTESLTGLVQRVYGNPELAGPPLVERRSTRIDVAAIAADPELPQREMSVRWTGYWFVPNGGPVHVLVNADDVVRLWIDDELVAHRHVTGGFRALVDPVTLEPGIHHVRVEFVQYGGGMALDVGWASPGGDYQPFARARLFPARPDDDVIVAAARARTLRALEPIAWAALALVVVACFVVPGLAAGGAWVSSRPVVVGSLDALRTLAVDWRLGPAAALATSAAAIGWAVWLRAGAINPVTLWADDVWVAALASLPSLVDAVTVHAPVPPGFVVLQWLVRRVSSVPAAPLQMIPLACGLGMAMALGVAAARVSGSRMVGVAALVLGLLDPFMAQVSVFVKQYPLDGLIAVWLLLLAVDAARGRGRSLTSVVLIALGCLLFSFPSIFMSAALVHVQALASIRPAGRSAADGWRSVVRPLSGFYAGALAIYWFVLSPRASPGLQRGWRRQFVPVSDADLAADFVQTRATGLLDQALPEPLALLAPLVVVGLVWLFVRREWRAVAWFFAGTYAALFVAASAGFYPIGLGYEGRVVLFSDPLVLFLVAIGAQALWSWSPLRGVLNAAGAIAVLLFFINRSVPVTYFDHDHSRVVSQILAKAEPSDAVVLNHRASYLVAVYSDWPRTNVANGQSEGFHIRFARPLTVTLPAVRQPDAADLADLDALLAERPVRLFFFSIRRDTAAYEDRIARAGYRQVEKRMSTTRAVYAVFERRPGAADGAGTAR